MLCFLQIVWISSIYQGNAHFKMLTEIYFNSVIWHVLSCVLTTTNLVLKYDVNTVRKILDSLYRMHLFLQFLCIECFVCNVNVLLFRWLWPSTQRCFTDNFYKKNRDDDVICVYSKYTNVIVTKVFLKFIMLFFLCHLHALISWNQIRRTYQD